MAKKNNTLADLLILWVEKMAFTLGKSTALKNHFSTHKINAKTSDFTTKLLKPLLVISETKSLI